MINFRLKTGSHCLDPGKNYLVPIPEWGFWMVKKFASDERSNFADIVDTISRSYDKADEVKFRRQTITSIFGMGTIYPSLFFNSDFGYSCGVVLLQWVNLKLKIIHHEI